MSQVFYLPTRIYSGAGCVIEHSQAFSLLGKKAMIVTGRASAKKNGSEADVIAALNKENISFVLFDRVKPNPGVAEVREAVEIVHKEKVDFIIAIGGGSPLDAGKAIAVLSQNELTDEALFQNKYTKQALPIAAVPTTAGTGSEVTQYSILTNDAVQSKTSLSHEWLFPRIAFLDERYTKALPLQVTVNTALDALSHAVEGYMSNRAGDFSRTLALQALTQSGEALRELAKSGKNGISDNLRSQLLRVSTLAGMVIAHTGTTAGHAMGYSLTYFKDIDHGRANGLLMCSLLSYMVKAGAKDGVQAVLMALGYKNLKGFKKLVDTLLGPKELLTTAEKEQFASIAIKAKNIANTPGKMTKEDILTIYGESLPSA